jgi:hypothetical protein
LAVPYENAVGKYRVGKSVTRTQRPLKLKYGHNFDSRLIVSCSSAMGNVTT